MSAQRDHVSLLPNGGWDERILVCACDELVQTCVVVTRRYVVLVDTMLNPQTATALLAIAQPHLDGRQLLVVNTHADWDHAWGNQLFDGSEAVHPAPIIGSRRCAERMRSPEEQAVLAGKRTAKPEHFDGIHLVPPTLLFDDRLLIDGGDLTLELFATPGHQPDHIAVFIPEISTLLAGDAAEEPFPLVNDPAGLPQLRLSLAKMAALKASTAIYCHAPMTAGPALLQANIAYFDALEAQCRYATAHILPSEPLSDADLEALTSYTLATTILPGIDIAVLPDLYRDGHRQAMRAMLMYVRGDSR